MASKRHVRRKQCEGKLKFPDQPAAQRAAASHMKTYGQWMTGYRCKFCNGFHIGHPPKYVRQAIIAKRERL